MFKGVNITKIFIIVLLSLYTTSAHAGRRDKSRWGDDLTYNHFGFAGTRVSFMNDVIPIGMEGLLALHVAGNFFMGFNFGQDVGSTKNSYGYYTPNVSNYYLDISSLGLNLEYVLHHDKRSAITFHLIGGVETISLGNVSSTKAKGFDEPFYVPSLTFHQSVMRNKFISLRPALTYTTNKVAFMAAYNFLRGDASFGKNTDFQGFQLEVCFNWKKTKRYGY